MVFRKGGMDLLKRSMRQLSEDKKYVHLGVGYTGAYIFKTYQIVHSKYVYSI